MATGPSSRLASPRSAEETYCYRSARVRSYVDVEDARRGSLAWPAREGAQVYAEGGRCRVGNSGPATVMRLAS